MQVGTVAESEAHCRVAGEVSAAGSAHSESRGGWAARANQFALSALVYRPTTVQAFAVPLVPRDVLAIPVGPTPGGRIRSDGGSGFGGFAGVTIAHSVKPPVRVHYEAGTGRTTENSSGRIIHSKFTSHRGSGEAIRKRRRCRRLQRAQNRQLPGSQVPSSSKSRMPSIPKDRYGTAPGEVSKSMVPAGRCGHRSDTLARKDEGRTSIYAGD